MTQITQETILLGIGHLFGHLIEITNANPWTIFERVRLRQVEQQSERQCP